MKDDIQKQRAQMDQAGAWLREYLPPMWWGLFNGCIAEGFTEEQAFKLVRTYVLAQAANGINGCD